MRKTMLAAALAGGCLGLAAECHTPTATAAGPTCTARFVTAKHSAFNKQPCEKPCSGGVFHFYGNQKAMQGFNSGKFEDGSIIADEVLETWGEGVSAKEGPRRVVGVMVKDSRKYADTGGWGFASFDGDSRTEKLSATEKQACFQCHLPKKDRDYVFTECKER